MTNVVENLLKLSKEVQELREKEKKHFDALWEAKQGRRLTEIRLDEANKKIDVGEKAWETERQDWEKERANLTIAKTDAENAKAEAESKAARIQADLDRVRFQLSTAEAQLKEAKAQASWAEEQWYTKWQAFEACDKFCAEVGQVSHKMGEDEALARLKTALADSCPTAD